MQFGAIENYTTTTAMRDKWDEKKKECQIITRVFRNQAHSKKK